MIKSVIRSNKDLKKNGYKLIRKLRKMRTKKGAMHVYGRKYESTYTFILYCESLIKILDYQYSGKDFYTRSFSVKCYNFINYLKEIACNKSKIRKSVLADFLRAYNIFFNKIIKQRTMFDFNQSVVLEWNKKCVMAYVATW